MVKVRLLPKLDDVLLVDTDHRVSNPQIKWGGEIEETKGGYPLFVDANTGQEHLVRWESPQKAGVGVVFRSQQMVQIDCEPCHPCYY